MSEKQQQREPRSRRILQLAPALIGLLGVLIGAGVTTGVAYLGDRNRRLADERAAVRLVVLEIRTDEVDILNAARFGDAQPLRDLPESQWREEQGMLARYVSDEAWHRTAAFYADVAFLKTYDLQGVGGCINPEGIRVMKETVVFDGARATKALTGENFFPHITREHLFEDARC